MPSVDVLHPPIDRMANIQCQYTNQPYVYHASALSLLHPCTNTTHRPCRKPRIVGAVEEVHKSVDNYCIDRLGLIQAAKERHSFNLKQQAGHTIRLHPYCRLCVVYT